ncbi:MAG: DUF2508 family protein [Clostridia bacterium]|nr:DUF2508 family protein [Clostridia bacterium]
MNLSVKKIFEMVTDMFSNSPQENDSVARLLENAKNEIRDIRANIDMVNDSDVLDMYIYRLKAAEAQYRQLLKMAKESGNRKKTG